MTGGTDRVGRPLDWLNFFLADVRDGLGPYLAIYPLTARQWEGYEGFAENHLAAVMRLLDREGADWRD